MRVITPVLKSVGFLLKTMDQQEQGNTITLRVTDEFFGYETVTYAVGGRKDDGVRVALSAVELNRGS